MKLIISKSLLLKCLVGGGSLILAGFVGTLVEDFWHDAARRLTAPYIAVVVSERSIDFPIPAEFLKGFRAARGGTNYVEIQNGRRVEVREREDLGSGEHTARIANELVNDENCILVIGNSTSTLTDITLDIFLRSDDPPAYILPIATANELVTKANSRKDNPVPILRMVPDNALQADVIQRLVRKLAPNQRVAIYGDQENAFYSVSLTRDIASRIRDNRGNIIIEETLGPTNSIYASGSVWRLKESAPEIIIYAGVAHHGLLLIDQLAALNITVPVVFTDGCMVGALKKHISRIPNRAFVLSPVAASEKATDQMPTYEPVGKDAYALAERIIKNCQPSTRSAVRTYVAANRDQLQVSNGNAGSYRFNAEGDNLDMKWKVYEITRGTMNLFIEY